MMSVMALMMPQTMKAQEDSKWTEWAMHVKDNNPQIKVDSKPEEIVNILMKADGYEGYTLAEGFDFVLQKKDVDKSGNVHVTYNQKDKESDKFTHQQLILHFRADGSLYYRNGAIYLEKNDVQNAKPLNANMMMSAKKAALIATGSQMNDVMLTMTKHQNKIHKAYRVKDIRTMSHVYVDAYTGEVLFSIPLTYTYDSWDKVQGTAVTLPASTSYYGTQDVTFMQTDKGYILRDPDRNIVTIDATLTTRDDGIVPPLHQNEQYPLVTEITGDVLITDKDNLLNPKPDFIIKGLYIALDKDKGVKPEAVNIHLYYIDEDGKPLDDILKKDFTNIKWENDSLKYKFDEPLALKLINKDYMLEVTTLDKKYTRKNAIHPTGDMFTNSVKIVDEEGKEEFPPFSLQFDYDVYATQQAVDAHWGIQKVYDMYKEYYGIKGNDGKGTQILNIIDPSRNFSFTQSLPDNAFAVGELIEDCNKTPTYVMVYGMGKPELSRTFTAFDIIAHEYTHLVTLAYGNNLEYKNESGALNEALADCMAMVAEDYVFDKPTWLMGEDLCLEYDFYRSLSNPWLSKSINGKINDELAHPKYYGGKYWLDYKDESTDNGGVHINNGVFNHLFYLLCEGGNNLTNEKGDTRDINPVGLEKMKDILFHSMEYYNSGLCDYAEIADNLMIAVEDVYGDNSETVADLQKKMSGAYEHVGLKSNNVPTGITYHQMATKASDSRTYSLYGMPVGDDYKGIVIKNGKKMIQNR